MKGYGKVNRLAMWFKWLFWSIASYFVAWLFESSLLLGIAVDISSKKIDIGDI